MNAPLPDEEQLWELMALLEWPHPVRKDLNAARDVIRELIYLRQELPALRADANRYRWFRDHRDSTWEVVSLFQKRPTVIMRFQFDSLDRVPLSLDVAVDEARATELAQHERDENDALEDKARG